MEFEGMPLSWLPYYPQGFAAVDQALSLGLSQEELAQRVGVRRETIGNLEKGKYNPSLVLAWRIAAVFQVTIEEIFTVEA